MYACFGESAPVSSMVMMHIILVVKWASWVNYGQKARQNFSPSSCFFGSRISIHLFGGLVGWHLWIGRARDPGPTSLDLEVEVVNV